MLQPFLFRRYVLAGFTLEALTKQVHLRRGAEDEPGSPLNNWRQEVMTSSSRAMYCSSRQQGCESRGGILTINRCYPKHAFSACTHTHTHTHAAYSYATLCILPDFVLLQRNCFYDHLYPLISRTAWPNLSPAEVRSTPTAVSVSSADVDTWCAEPTEAAWKGEPPAIVTLWSHTRQLRRPMCPGDMNAVMSWQ